VPLASRARHGRRYAAKRRDSSPRGRVSRPMRRCAVAGRLAREPSGTFDGAGLTTSGPAQGGTKRNENGGGGAGHRTSGEGVAVAAAACGGPDSPPVPQTAVSGLPPSRSTAPGPRLLRANSAEANSTTADGTSTASIELANAGVRLKSATAGRRGPNCGASRASPRCLPGRPVLGRLASSEIRRKRRRAPRTSPVRR